MAARKRSSGDGLLNAAVLRYRADPSEWSLRLIDHHPGVASLGHSMGTTAICG